MQEREYIYIYFLLFHSDKCTLSPTFIVFFFPVTEIIVLWSFDHRMHIIHFIVCLKTGFIFMYTFSVGLLQPLILKFTTNILFFTVVG